MFNTGRYHRLLTVPALTVALVAIVVGGHPVYAVAIFPVFAAMPWLLRAAALQTFASIEDALTATRAFSYIGIAWAVVVAMLCPPAGGLQIAGLAIVVIAAGRRASEFRLAVVVIVSGLLLALAACLLMWLGTAYFLTLPAGIAMLIGGTWWLAEAARQPVTLEPELPFAIASIA